MPRATQREPGYATDDDGDGTGHRAPSSHRRAAGAPRRDSAARREGGRRRARRRRRRWPFLLGTVAVVGGAAFVVMHKGGKDSGSDTTAAATPAHASGAGPARPAAPPAATTVGPPSTTASGSASPSAGPASGSGRFDTADASGKASGSGKIRRYKVQVEQGVGISAETAAQEIEDILADPRGWTADGHDGFQLVSGGSFDFEVKIATPATVDKLCGAAGLHTHGEVNCDVGDQVIVNLKRWNTGSPEFSGPVPEYRALIINHEVGHRIGHGHETCPGPGKPAPAMMQQIDGLRGCVANAWPYDTKGNYLGGPKVP